MEDTIVAISTLVGNSAINIIRLSGKDSINITNKLFNRDLINAKPNTINYGKIIGNKEEIDEVLISIFKSPKSYTTEDMIEINCHGGIATTNKILELLLQSGARLAEPGEFIKRAFLNGRIDLIEAESVGDIINSTTENARKLSMNGLNGKVTQLITKLREQILEIVANIEVNINYPEYEDALDITNNLLKEKIEILDKKFTELLKQSSKSNIIKNGLDVAIIGKPNVGKSSILNKLIGEEKAIVTNIEGTTRDIVEGNIYINGIKINFIDTAGIRETKDVIEKIGVNKSKEILNQVDLILFVLNNNTELTKDEQILLESIKNKNTIIILNKIDLETKINKTMLKQYKIIETTTLKENGTKQIEEEIKRQLNIGNIELGDFTYLSNNRQITILKECIKILKEIETATNNNDPVDLIEIDLKILWEKLGGIIGETYEEALLDEIFSKFCLGK